MRWGIDLGGTKIEGAVLPEGESLEPLCRLRVPTEGEKGYDHILSQIQLLARQMEKASGRRPSRIGFGTPGISDPVTGLMKNCNSTALNGRLLAEDLRATLGCEVKLANDANCFALAEATFGAGRGASSVFGVILGTGVGGGIVIDGRLHLGYQGIAGEWGHNRLENDGVQCYCGKRGCVETVLSGPSLERYYTGRCGDHRSLAEIASRARTGADAFATETLDRLVSNFGQAISVVVNILDPETIVVGGGVGNIDELYREGFESLKRHVFNDSLRTKVVGPELGDSAGVFGAAQLFEVR